MSRALNGDRLERELVSTESATVPVLDDRSRPFELAGRLRRERHADGHDPNSPRHVGFGGTSGDVSNGSDEGDQNAKRAEGLLVPKRILIENDSWR
jgi:hypothetical protein